MTRRPIVGMLGHVDHGKTTLLDSIRSTSTQANEAGHITQHIGATEIPVSHVESVLPPGLDIPSVELPGLLMIDTPGHKSFTSLRSRGGSMADIAVLVVDIMDGVQPQTREAIRILQNHETPFLVAANKVDTVPYWRTTDTTNVKPSFTQQSDSAQTALKESVYELIGQLSDHDITAELYWNVRDFTSTVSVVPTNAQTGTGLPNVLSLLFGLSQRYLTGSLDVDTETTQGTVLEVTTEPGLGTVVDVLLHSGTLRVGDDLAVGGPSITTTTVRSLQKPIQLQDTRSSDTRFESVSQVDAATGVRIAAAHLGETQAGALIQSPTGSQQTLTPHRSKLPTETNGAVVKGDTQGSIEAVVSALSARELPVARTGVGKVTSKDVHIASTMDDSWDSAVVAFNTGATDKAVSVADSCQVDILTDPVIHQLTDLYEEYVTRHKACDAIPFEQVVKPAKLHVLTDVPQDGKTSVAVEKGTLTDGVRLSHAPDADADIGTVQAIHRQETPVTRASTGDTVRISMTNVPETTDISASETVWVTLPETHSKLLLSSYESKLSQGECDALEEYTEHMREYHPFWGT